MNILISGSNGYIGGRLVEYLLRFKDFKLFLSSRKNFNQKNNNIRFLKINWQNSEDVLNSCKNMDVVIHLASMNSKACSEYPEDAKIFNINNTLKFFESAIKNKVKKFIFISSIHVYGDQLIAKINENSLKNPISMYAYTKSVAEDKLLKLNKDVKTKLFILRLSNVFGPPVNNFSDCWSLVFNDLSYQAIKTRNIIMKSNGKQMRNFITMTDFCRSINHIIKFLDNKNEYNVFNIGGEKNIQILDVLNLIKDRSKIYVKDINVSFSKAFSNFNEKEFVYDISRFISTGFKLEKDFVEELDELLRFIENN